MINERYVDEPRYWHPLLTMEMPNLLQQFDLKMSKVIAKQNQGLLDLVEKMVLFAACQNKKKIRINKKINF